ncbi:hypothetical protein AO376_1229 [Moraxella catarrhalis]|nr:hypothetical protein AO376_1229 [Moraxella catarrhalis]OAV16525.1 hypothetical protein AO374_1659 [Moraxella catarrhalis]
MTFQDCCHIWHFQARHCTSVITDSLNKFVVKGMGLAISAPKLLDKL